MNKWIVSDAWKSVAVLVVCGLAAARSDAKVLYEPNTYAMDGLILQLDGIRNVGMFKAHDNAAPVWVDLSPSANIAVFGNTTGNNITSEWAPDGYTVGYGDYGRLERNINVGNIFTIQIICDMTPSAQTSTYPSLFGAADDKCNFYTYNTGSSINFKTDGKAGRVESGGWGGRYVTALYSNANAVVFHTVTGNLGSSKNNTGSIGSRAYYIGGVYKSSDANYLVQRYLNGTIKSIRIYNRILTNEELESNRAIDEIRFFSSIPVTNAVVASSVPGVEANEATGVYAVDEDGHTFSAPAKTTGTDGTVYACAGYTLETWDADTGAWAAPVRKASMTCPVTDAGKVRITWLWVNAGSTAGVALDPYFDDYVTDGLVFQVDGIRNAGIDQPHDYGADTWVDLVGGKVASFFHEESDGSQWMADGFYFGGSSCFQFRTNLTGLAKIVTAEVVCDVDTTAQKKGVNWPTLFGCNDNDALNIYYNGGYLYTKNANGGRLSMGGWKGLYATTIRDTTTNYLFQTTTTNGAASVAAASGNIGDVQIRIGSAGNTVANVRLRYLVGTVKAVRIYDRVLTDEELAQNRAIDEVRFFKAPLPQTNVVVTSSVRGVAGDTPEGSYALAAGGHTFTAPATVTIGEDTYACTGYTLETWDASTDTWGAPVLYSGVLAAAITDTTALVRLTWQWTHTAGPGYDAAFNDYATDGLVLQLDGIRNTGLVPVHNDRAATWPDLSGEGGYAAFVNATTDGGAWTVDGYRFGGKSYAAMRSVRTLGTNYTAQSVSAGDLQAMSYATATWPHLIGTTTSGDKFDLYYSLSGTVNPYVRFKGLNTMVTPDRYNWNGEYATVWSDGVEGSLFMDATVPVERDAFSQEIGTWAFTIGSANGSGSAYGARYFIGPIKAARIYNRALTDVELVRNRAIDEARFFRRAPSVPQGEVLITSDVEGLAGDQPVGTYRPADAYTFSAPPVAMLDGTPYELTGYTLETWDATEGVWSSPVSYESSSYTVPASSASRRITWQWRVKSRLTRVREDYDVGDYAQNGIFLHFDGIRNVGAAADHDDTAEQWTNLAGNNHALFDYERAGATPSAWTTNGYVFTYGGKFAYLTSNPNLGNSITIQAVCEVNETERSSGGNWPSFFGSTNDFCNLYTTKASFDLWFKIFNNRGEKGDVKAGGRTQVQPSGSWEGRYITSIWHQGKYAVFQTTTPATNIWAGKWCYNTESFKGCPFYIGGIYFENSENDVNHRRLIGTLHALRVYKRVLTDEELTQNRKVDEARFFGKLSDWNVQVAMGKYDASDEAVGHYLVEGAYTFTAGTATTPSGGHRSVVGYTVEPWDETNGVWGAPVPGNGDSYTYTDGTSPAKVRLTWKWRADGAVLLIR